MNLKPASASDYPVLLQIWEDSVRASHDFLPEARLQALKPMLLDSYFPQVNLWLWQDAAQQCLGFIGVAEANIEMLFVHPQAQGLGIGKALLSHAIHQLGANHVDVNEQNPKALAFYQHAGFEITARSEQDGQGWPYPLLHMYLPNQA